MTRYELQDKAASFLATQIYGEAVRRTWPASPYGNANEVAILQDTLDMATTSSTRTMIEAMIKELMK